MTHVNSVYDKIKKDIDNVSLNNDHIFGIQQYVYIVLSANNNGRHQKHSVSKCRTSKTTMHGIFFMMLLLLMLNFVVRDVTNKLDRVLYLWRHSVDHTKRGIVSERTWKRSTTPFLREPIHRSKRFLKTIHWW